ncbi:MAG: tetratricopeptide repeat protein, partial [Clostridium sartagoforme]|nr:tetratricopeptide repeat protein [Clostridium sartagoforme]
MKNGLIRILSSLFIIFTLLTLFSCNNTSKKITVSEDTINEVSIEESEIIKSIAAAEKLLDEGKLQEAKEYFNKAIRIDKTNKDTYLRIKDKYLSINNTDEAYSIIKTAITNNVDTENMKLILKEISSKFELIKLPFTVYQDSNYSLPNEVSINMYDTEISIPITWSTTTVDTSNLGTFTYEGYNDEYGRKVIIDLTIIENVYDKQIGCIKNIYSINGKTYIDIDLVEFYLGDEISLAEAIKDNNAGINEKGEYFLPNPYYIRNNYSKLTTYEISKDCLIQLMDV